MPHLFEKDSRIYVAGHRGLVGSAVVRRLREAGYKELILHSSLELDLRDQAATSRFFDSERPEFVVLAAARVGGILANDTFPADFIGDNITIQMNVLRSAHAVGVRRLIFLGSSCIYPRDAPQPLKEKYLLTGPLESTNQWYAVAKIAGIKTCQAYRAQHRSDFVSLMPSNLYGPGDNFDLRTSHVLPALIRKFHEAKRPGGADVSVTLWGTGDPRREFLHSDDLAEACRLVLELPEEDLWAAAPDGLINVGAGTDLTIRELANLIRDVVDSKSEIVHDRTKPDGTYQKLLDISRMRALGWSPRVELREGLRQTYDWYVDQLTSRPVTVGARP